MRGLPQGFLDIASGVLLLLLSCDYPSTHLCALETDGNQFDAAVSLLCMLRSSAEPEDGRGPPQAKDAC